MGASLEIHVHADGFDQCWPTIFVVAGVINELKVKCIKKTAPRVQVVVAFDDVFPAIVQLAIAEQKAELTGELFMQVRNKAISAYQEIMKMQL